MMSAVYCLQCSYCENLSLFLHKLTRAVGAEWPEITDQSWALTDSWRTASVFSLSRPQTPCLCVIEIKGNCSIRHMELSCELPVPKNVVFLWKCNYSSLNVDETILLIFRMYLHRVLCRYLKILMEFDSWFISL